MTESNSIPNGNPALFAGDDPILSTDDDLLNRSRLASAIAEEVQIMNVTRGAVVAITGKWGTGKTSLLNLTANILREQDAVQVVEFNPWYFSGTDHLIQFFFDEMARQLSSERNAKKKLKDAAASISAKFNKYSASLSPLKFIPMAGVVFEAAQKAAEGVSQAFSSSIHEQRIEISEALEGLNGRIVVLIDDIDRLTRQEVRDLFRLVRLNGSFPNVVYLLCFDRGVVESALGEEGLNGAAYLEKIVKTSVEVPPATDEALASLLRTGIVEVLYSASATLPNEGRLPDVFWQVVRPLFVTVRDVKRFISSLALTVRSASDEVDPVDLVALEAIRVMRPKAHDLIAQSVNPLTAVHGWQAGARNQAAISADAEAVSAILRELPHDVGGAFVRFIFPAAQLHTENIWYGSDSTQAWRRDRRVAHATVLRYYLHRELPSGTAPASQVSSLIYSIQDENEFESALASVPDGQLEDVLDRFLAHVDAVDMDRIAPVAASLLGTLPRFSEDPVGIFDFGRDYTALRPVLRLMKRVIAEDVDAVARVIYEATPSLYARLRFISLVGKETESGERIISAELEEELRGHLRDSIKSAPVGVLRSERQLLRTVVQSVECDAESGQLAFDAAVAPPVTARLLETALSPSRSNTLGSVVVRSEDRLAWDALVSIFGGEAQLAVAVDGLKDYISNQETSVRLHRAIAAFDLYIGGWRPREF